jgi:mannosyl-oligosaccharide alpha-1,2-mannosidase
MLRKFTILRSTPLRFLQPQTRARFLILAIIVLILLNYLASIKQTNKSPYIIQAVFSPESTDAKAVRLRRQEQVKDAFLHAWKGYKEHAWLHDEVMPLTGGHKDTFVGWAATLVDGLDTLYIMGLKNEFEYALKALEQIDFSKPNAERVPVFETTIRYLGGLLGAWDISGHQYPILRQKATELGDFLYRAFDTESGIPVPYYRWMEHYDKKLAGQDGVLVAQIGSLSLEFIRLSQVTGDAKYANAVQRITDQLKQTQNSTAIPGMWPSKADYGGGNLTFSGRDFTLGAFAGRISHLCLHRHVH